VRVVSNFLHPIVLLSCVVALRRCRSSDSITLPRMCSEDHETAMAFIFLKDGEGLVASFAAKGRTIARYHFGIKSADGPVERLLNTVTCCCSLSGFYVVFANANSPQLHCLPLGDDTSSPSDFFPVLAFSACQGACGHSVLDIQLFK
jgi:hypothetical protein